MASREFISTGVRKVAVDFRASILQRGAVSKQGLPQAWTRLSRGAEHDFTIVRVREDRVRDPRDGSEHPRVIFECRDWVTVMALTPADELILVRQFRFGVWANTLEAPGGIVDAGEAPESAAARELEEETGYQAGRLVPLGATHPNPAWQTNRCHAFLALDCRKVHGGRPDAGEDLAVELHPRASIPELVLSGTVSHALVVVAFFLERLRAGLS